MQKKNKTVVFGVIFIFIGLSLLFNDYLHLKKVYAFNYMNDKLFADSETIVMDSTTETTIVTEKEESKTIKQEETNSTPVTTESSSSKKNNKKNTNTNTSTSENYYIGYLEIPKIKFKRGFVSMNSKENDLSKNITIIKPSQYPNVKKGNLIIAGHSGSGYLAFFKNLYKLKINDYAYVYYKNIKYSYKLVNIYTQPKNGSVGIYRNYKKKGLTLITCTKNDKKTQTIYIFEIVKETKIK